MGIQDHIKKFSRVENDVELQLKNRIYSIHTEEKFRSGTSISLPIGEPDIVKVSCTSVNGETARILLTVGSQDGDADRIIKLPAECEPEFAVEKLKKSISDAISDYN